MLLPSGHYSGDLKKVSTMTSPFLPSKLARDALWSNRGWLCIVSPVQEKTNPKKGHQMLSEDNMGQWATPISALTSLTSWSKHWPGAKVCPLPLETDCPCLLIDFFETAPPLIWKKAPGRSKVPGSQGTSRRWTDTQTLRQLFPFLWNPISANLHSNEMASDKLQSKAIKSQRVWSIGFSEIRLVMQWRLGQLGYLKNCLFCLKLDTASWVTDILCKCWSIMMMMMMMRVGFRSV